MKHLICAIFIGVLLTGCGDETNTATPDQTPAPEVVAVKAVKHFDNVTDMMNDLGDYFAEAGQFELISEEPPHFILSPFFFKNDDPRTRIGAVRRMALYGVWRTFAHTDADTVTVEILPRLVTDLTQSNKAPTLPEEKISITVSRTYALNSLKQHAGITSFDDLISDGSEEYTITGLSWSGKADELQKEGKERDTLYNDLLLAK